MRMRFGLLSLALVTLAACKQGDSSASAPPAPVATAVVQTAAADGGAAKQGIAVTANDKGFTPSSIEIKKGTPATITFTRTTDDTCAKQVVFPALKLEKDLPLNTPVAIDLPATDAQTLVFQCGMGMFRGKILVN